MEPVSLERALEAFVEGFTYTRSFTHPYLVHRYPGMAIMRDKPRPHERVAEVVTCLRDAEDLLARLRPVMPPRHAICAVSPFLDHDEGMKRSYKAAGYRLGRTEGLFVRDLTDSADLPDADGSERILTNEAAQRLNHVAGTQIRPADLLEDPPRLRQYAWQGEGGYVGWVRSITTSDGDCWVSNLYVHPNHRRKGIASRLMARMLEEDRANGAELSVLLASHSGAKLYPRLGYRQIGTLHLFTPARSGNIGT